MGDNVLCPYMEGSMPDSDSEVLGPFFYGEV